MKTIERGTIPSVTTATVAPYSQRRTIVASAAKLNLRDSRDTQEAATQRAAMSEWQQAAWFHYGKIGQIKYAYNLVADIMSRIRVYPAFVSDVDSPPVPLTDAVTIKRPEGEIATRHHRMDGLSADQAIEARDLFRKAISPSDVPVMFRSFSLNINVPGECLLAEIDGRWRIKSTKELQILSDGNARMFRARGGMPREIKKGEISVGRIWREHPEYSFEPDSSLRALEDDCEEYMLLSRVIRSNSRARLNAGILFVPEELSLYNSTPTDDEEVEEDEEALFEKELGETLAAPVENEESANTVIPLLLRGPGEMGDKIKHILLERKTDEFLVQRATETYSRILEGLDVPKDIVTGLSHVKYSNAVQIDDSLYKAHIEPLALLFCDAITDIIYRPLLVAKGWSEEDARRMVAWYDPSEVVTRPDRAADAQKLYDANELSGAALRNSYGFNETDKPTEEELAIRTAVKNIPPQEIMSILYQKAFPGVLRQTQSAQAAASALPDSLSQQLDGTDTPATPELTPTVGE